MVLHISLWYRNFFIHQQRIHIHGLIPKNPSSNYHPLSDQNFNKWKGNSNIQFMTDFNSFIYYL